MRYIVLAVIFIWAIFLSISVYADLTGKVVDATVDGSSGVYATKIHESSKTLSTVSETTLKELGQPVDNGKVQPALGITAPPDGYKNRPNEISTKPAEKNNANSVAGEGGASLGIWGDTLAQWLMAIMAVLATAISVYVAFVIKRTLNATVGLLAEATNTTREAEAANKSSQKLLRQNRAWLTIDLIEDETLSRINNVCQIPIRWKNTGQSPALNLEHSFAYRVVPLVENISASELKIQFAKEEIITAHQNSIGAGQSCLQYFPLTDKMIERVRDAKNKVMFVIGTWVSYETIHGEKGYTETAFVPIPIYGKTTDEPGFIFMPLKAHNVCK